MRTKIPKSQRMLRKRKRPRSRQPRNRLSRRNPPPKNPRKILAKKAKRRIPRDPDSFHLSNRYVILVFL
jgi:hypothetical protein